ncbi:histidine phosphatase family protein [Corynebacterium sp. 4HC-13]|uniref:histidine phosphatase family protein n=1 Tax=Corynebacterium anserum TaxID=2684406 RepID=UPI00163A2D21|nr:histidine phosphatase family protein [Corynebacterium anserum]MBC2681458.1 histidine phosphatase family protein [Corynebacterium anserum]
MSHLFLVRHGQTTSNEIRALDTALPGADLTELGREQATSVGRILAQRSSCLHVLSSQAARAQQTAAQLAASFVDFDGCLAPSGPGSAFSSFFTGKDLSSFSDATATFLAGELGEKLAMIHGVSEIPAGNYEMKTDHDSLVGYHTILGSWMAGSVELSMPGGSTGAQVLRTYVTQLLALMAAVKVEEQMHPAGTKGSESAEIALVSHGAVIRLVARYLGAVDPEWAFQGYLQNSHFIQLEIPRNVDQLAEAIAQDFLKGYGAFTIVEWGEHGRPQPYSPQTYSPRTQ